MPASAAEPHHAGRQLLQQHGVKHLRTRKHGGAVIVESGPATDPIEHFRMRRDTVHLRRLDMATHTGRWEATPFRTQLQDLVTLVLETVPWTLAPIA